MSPDPDSEPRWHPLEKVLFRFFCVYYVLYTFPFPYVDPLPGAAFLGNVWNPAVTWVGRHVLGIGYTIGTESTGSGDRTYDYVQFFTMVTLALAGCLVWSLVDRKRRHYRGLAKWLTVGCRYFLAYVMLSYGFHKVIKMQFSFPGLDRLLQTYGDSSPMRLVWTFMGFSTPYTVFAGAGEVLGGLLLLWRRTTTFGALVVIAVMSNVVMMNFSYDVPVKLFSSHLLLMGCALLALDYRRVLDVLVLNRATAPAEHPPHFAGRRANVARLAVKTLVIAFVLYYDVSTNLEMQKTWGSDRPQPPLYGIWDVETFVMDGQERPPLTTDGQRWQHLIIEWEGEVSVRLMNGERKGYLFEPDVDAKTIALATYQDRDAKLTWTYEQPTPETLNLKGELAGSVFSIETTRRGPEDFLLVNRGFNWVNEVPYNR